MGGRATLHRSFFSYAVRGRLRIGPERLRSGSGEAAGVATGFSLQPIVWRRPVDYHVNVRLRAEAVQRGRPWPRSLAAARRAGVRLACPGRGAPAGFLYRPHGAPAEDARACLGLGRSGGEGGGLAGRSESGDHGLSKGQVDGQATAACRRRALRAQGRGQEYDRTEGRPGGRGVAGLGTV